jgi:tetratricopeptide (TPR) repeat protein
MANIYQLIRVQVPTAELDAFVGKPERPGRCAPTMLLLAVLVGFPQHADVFLRRVSRAAPGERLMSLLDSAEGQGLKRLRIALTALAESEGPWPPLVEAYRTEIPRVSGFSFRTAVDLELTSIGAEGTWGNVAAAAHNAGPPAEVLALYERTLAERERILGAEHPDTLISRMDLAGAYEAAGRLPEAMPLLKRAATDTERLRDPAHPALAAVLYRLGVAHARLGDLAAAVAAFDRAVEVDTAAYGPDHPEVATDLEALAAVLGQQGNADGAAAAQARAQRIRQQQKKPGVPTE